MGDQGARAWHIGQSARAPIESSVLQPAEGEMRRIVLLAVAAALEAAVLTAAMCSRGCSCQEPTSCQVKHKIQMPESVLKSLLQPTGALCMLECSERVLARLQPDKSSDIS